MTREEARAHSGSTEETIGNFELSLRVQALVNELLIAIHITPNVKRWERRQRPSQGTYA